MTDLFFSSAEFPLFLDEMNSGFVLLDDEKRVAFANKWFLKAAGLACGDVRARCLSELFANNMNGRLSTAVNEAFSARRSTLLTSKLNKTLFPLHTPAGTKMYQRITVKPFGDVEQRPRCIIQIEDVTDSFEREKNLKEKRKEASSGRSRLNTILQNTADGIVTIDSKGVIETVNQAVEKLFGYSAEEMIGQNVSMLLPLNERDAHHQYVADSSLYASRIINNTRDLYGQHKDGSHFSLELNVSRMEIEGRTFLSA